MKYLIYLFLIFSLCANAYEENELKEEKEDVKIEDIGKVFSIVITMIDGEPNVLFNKQMISLSYFVENYSMSQKKDRVLTLFDFQLSMKDLERISIPSKFVSEPELRKYEEIKNY